MKNTEWIMGPSIVVMAVGFAIQSYTWALAVPAVMFIGTLISFSHPTPKQTNREDAE